MKALVVSAALAAAVALPSFAQTNFCNQAVATPAAQPTIVPAFYPLGADWNTIQASGPGTKVVVAEATFPGFASDPQALDAIQKQFAALHAQGQLVLGYVNTQFGGEIGDATAPFSEQTIMFGSTASNPPTPIRRAADGAVESYSVAQWYQAYPALDGIFFDNGPSLPDLGPNAPNDAAYQTYYTQLHSDFKTAHPAGVMMINASGYPNAWILNEADIVNVMEIQLPRYNTQFFVGLHEGGATQPPPSWWCDPANRGHISHVVSEVTNFASQLPAIRDFSQKNGTPLLYINDLGSGTYSHLDPNYDQYVPWTLTLQKGGSGTGTVASSIAGINCDTTCASASALFNPDQPVTLSATAAGNANFTGFSANCTVVTSTSCQISVAAASTVTATFNLVQQPPPNPTLSVVIDAGSGSGTITSSPTGISCPGTCSAMFAPQTVMLTAHPAGNSSFGGFVGISGCGTGLTCNVPFSAAATVHASFVANAFSLTVTKTTGGTVTSSDGAINCTSSQTRCTATYATAPTVNLTAFPDDGFSFSGFSGACSGATCNNLTPGASTMVNATFAVSPPPPPVALTVVIDAGASLGTITSNPAGINCGATCSAQFAPKTNVVLIASPGSNARFIGFTGGGCSGSATSCTVALATATTVHGSFEAGPFRLTINKTTGGTVNTTDGTLACASVQTSCSKTYATAVTVSISEMPDSGFGFSGWGGACDPNSISLVCRNVTVGADTEVDASFAPTSGGGGCAPTGCVPGPGVTCPAVCNPPPNSSSE